MIILLQLSQFSPITWLCLVPPFPPAIPNLVHVRGHAYKFFGFSISYTILFLKKGFIYLFVERAREGEREGEKHHCVVASHIPPTGDLAHNPGMCPRLGIELVSLWFADWCSVLWAILARVPILSLTYPPVYFVPTNYDF